MYTTVGRDRGYSQSGLCALLLNCIALTSFIGVGVGAAQESSIAGEELRAVGLVVAIDTMTEGAPPLDQLANIVSRIPACVYEAGFRPLEGPRLSDLHGDAPLPSVLAPFGAAPFEADHASSERMWSEEALRVTATVVVSDDGEVWVTGVTTSGGQSEREGSAHVDPLTCLEAFTPLDRFDERSGHEGSVSVRLEFGASPAIFTPEQLWAARAQPRASGATFGGARGLAGDADQGYGTVAEVFGASGSSFAELGAAGAADEEEDWLDVAEVSDDRGPMEFTIDVVEVGGGISEEAVLLEAERRYRMLLYCWEMHMRDEDDVLEGALRVSFVVMDSGTVMSPQAVMDQEDADALVGCVETAVRRWSFDRDDEGGLARITLRIAHQSVADPAADP